MPTVGRLLERVHVLPRGSVAATAVRPSRCDVIDVISDSRRALEMAFLTVLPGVRTPGRLLVLF